MDDSNILQETQEYAEKVTEKLNEWNELLEVGGILDLSKCDVKEENCNYIYMVLTYLQFGYISNQKSSLLLDLDNRARCYTCAELDLHTNPKKTVKNVEMRLAGIKSGKNVL
ncbi:hypothetical protein [Cellulophaga sp. BC115SP]|uniref:hypothetical protein n=1 Tax=Cellulophaga sp. BC115SP TaxID=2683263 RepID=UPI0014131DE8|nr:hypothetical protein [Cellulophaga sp. BC115SP]